jgi:hypothetical protein
VFQHSFSFDIYMDGADHAHPDEEILDYQYGDSGQFGTRANRERVQRGETSRQQIVYQSMPRGEFLNVKWRLKSTQKVYEETVDLRNTLPKDITGYGVHFAVRGPQLYVYLIPPPGTWAPSRVRKEPDYLLKHQIYPDSSK